MISRLHQLTRYELEECEQRTGSGAVWREQIELRGRGRQQPGTNQLVVAVSSARSIFQQRLTVVAGAICAAVLMKSFRRTAHNGRPRSSQLASGPFACGRDRRPLEPLPRPIDRPIGSRQTKAGRKVRSVFGEMTEKKSSESSVGVTSRLWHLCALAEDQRFVWSI